MEFSRRSILGGMLSILAASTTQIIPAPAAALLSNRAPRIFGDGRNYDSEGFQALFDGKDVIIPADKLQVTGAKGLIFHRGTFVIDKEVYTNGCQLLIENAEFDGRMLKWWECFFNHPASFADAQKLVGQAKWKRTEGSFSIDIGKMQFSTANTWMSEQNRFRPKALPDWDDGVSLIGRRG